MQALKPILTLAQALEKRAYGIAWRTAARVAIANGAKFLFIPV
jgi:homoserine acetyltransferase